MKIRSSALVVGLCLSISVQAEEPKAPPAGEVGYSFGQTFGVRLKDTMPDLDIETFIEGIQDAYSGKEPRLAPERIEQVMQEYQVYEQYQQQKLVEQQATANREAGEKYLAMNKDKAGVITTESGLQYRVIKSGEGNSPKLNDVVEVHYTGRLLNDEVFDSSEQRGQPVSFPVNGVIKGWVEALQLMKPGDRWELSIPADLAYGPRGTPNGRIGPNETLIFEVELLGIQK